MPRRTTRGIDGFDELFVAGAGHARRDAELFFEELCGPAPARRDHASAREDASDPIDVVVGQPVTIDLTPFFPAFKIERVEWTIAMGKAVGGYELDGTHARILPVSARGPQLKLHWIAGGRARVDCKVALSTGSQLMKVALSFDYDVRAPKLEHLTAKTGKPPRIHNVIIDTVRKKKRKQLGFGDEDVPGVLWDVRVTLPARLAGRFADLQLVRLGRRREMRFSGTTTAQKEVFSTDAGERQVLDIGQEARDCLDPLPWYGLPPAAVVTSEFARDHVFDIPAVDLVGDVVSVEIDESFEYYVLFKPEVEDAIWVPVAKAEWFWRAAARRRRGKWSRAAKPKPQGGVVGGKGGPTTDLPQYETSTCAADWMPA